MPLRTAALIALLLGGTGDAAAASVRVKGGGAPGCVRPEWVGAEVGRQVTVAGAEQVRLFARGDGRLQISLDRGGRRVASRSLSLTGEDCSAVERTAVLLLVSWWNLPAAPEAPGPARSPAPAPAPGTRSIPRASPPAPERVPEPPAEDAPPELDTTAPPLMEVLEPEPEPAAEPAPASPEVAQPALEPEPSTAAPPTSSLDFAVAVRGQGQFDGATGFGGHLAIDGGRGGGLGGYLDAGIESARRTSLGPGEVTVSPAFATVGGRWALRLEPLSVLLAAGARVYRLTANGERFDSNDRVTLLSPAVLVSAELRAPLRAGLFATAAIQGYARLREEQLVIRGLGVAQTVKPVGAALSVGLGWGAE